MNTYAIIDSSNIVVNCIVWDGISEWTPDEGFTAVQVDRADIGGTYDPVKNIVIPLCPEADSTYDEVKNTWIAPVQAPPGDPVKVTP